MTYVEYYNITGEIHGADLVAELVAAELPAVSYDDAQHEVTYSRSLTVAEQITAGRLVASHEVAHTFTALRAKRYAEADILTEKLEDFGVEWPVGSGMRIALTTATRQNIVTTFLLSQNPTFAAAMFPLPWDPTHGHGNLVFATAAEFSAFFMVAFQRYVTILTLCAQHKTAIAAADTLEDLVALVDPREGI